MLDQHFLKHAEAETFTSTVSFVWLRKTRFSDKEK